MIVLPYQKQILCFEILYLLGFCNLNEKETACIIVGKIFLFLHHFSALREMLVKY